jgi:hypothetical protein
MPELGSQPPAQRGAAELILLRTVHQPTRRRPTRTRTTWWALTMATCLVVSQCGLPGLHAGNRLHAQEKPAQVAQVAQVAAIAVMQKPAEDADDPATAKIKARVKLELELAARAAQLSAEQHAALLADRSAAVLEEFQKKRQAEQVNGARAARPRVLTQKSRLQELEDIVASAVKTQFGNEAMLSYQRQCSLRREFRRKAIEDAMLSVLEDKLALSKEQVEQARSRFADWIDIDPRFMTFFFNNQTYLPMFKDPNGKFEALLTPKQREIWRQSHRIGPENISWGDEEF